MENMTTIKVSMKTRDTLKEFGKMGDSYENVIKMLMDFYKENKR